MYFEFEAFENSLGRGGNSTTLKYATDNIHMQIGRDLNS